MVRESVFVLSLILLNLLSLHSQIITIGSTGDYATLEAAESSISAGDTLLLQSQIFSNGSQFLSNLIGTSTNPIVIIAETEHGAIFRGGSEAIHLISCEYVELNGIVFEQQTSNGVNIDDGGNRIIPAHHITIRNCIFRDMAGSGNNDLLKMSGVDDFLIEDCQFIDGSGGGSGIDFVGCHMGTVQDCYFENAGTTGIQCKGGSQYIRIQRNILKNMDQRALNLGGNTGLQYFRPPLSDPIANAFEAADIDVFSNIFIGSWAPIAYVGSLRIKVINNTFYKPENWVIRILQETTTSGFLPCSQNEFRNNIVYLENNLTEVNVGNNTAPATFVFSNNLWFNESSNSWSPVLPVTDQNQVIADPLFIAPNSENFNIGNESPAVESGITLSNPHTDFNNIPFFAPPSIGAFEGHEIILSVDNLQNLQVSLIQEFPVLKWSTSSEINNKGFEIQSSTNGQHWEAIGWVQGHGNTNKSNSYILVDKTPHQGINYYRYKQVDFDGKYKYSAVVTLDFKQLEISIFPNPTSSFLYIHNNMTNEFSNIIIYNLSGEIALKNRDSNGFIDVSNLISGIYTIVIELESKRSKRFRFIINR